MARSSECVTENNCGLRNSESGELVGAQQKGSIPRARFSPAGDWKARDLTTASPAGSDEPGGGPGGGGRQGGGGGGGGGGTGGGATFSTCFKDDRELRAVTSR